MPKDRSSIDEMRKRLYSRSKESVARKRRPLREIQYDTKKRWSDQKERPVFNESPKKRRPLLSTLLIASSIFFVIAILFSAYFFFGGSNVVSSQNIDIEIQGPVTISGGEELSLQIAITNRNNVSIKLADLLVEYPDGTRSATNISKSLPRHRETLGTLTPGQIMQRTVKAILLGSQDTQQNIKITVEYRIDGSNAIFFTEKIYDVTLISSPLGLSISGLDEATSDQEVDFTVTVVSNSNTTIKDALLVMEYPFGFEFISASPKPSFTDSVWDLGDIQSEGKRTIKLHGAIVGEDNEERVFRFSAGVKSERDEKELGVAFTTSIKSIIIKKPFVGVALALNGDQSSEYVSGIGNEVRADITWTNNMPVRVADGEIEVKLKGTALDKFSISVDKGFYRSSDNTIIYSRETNNELASLEPGESGRVAFSFSSLGLSSGSLFKNPEIILDVSIKGKRVSENQVPQEINSSITRTVKLASDLLLTSRAVYFTGPFTNTGPIPPEADKETTYTVIWTITNSSNIVDGTRVVASLPSYVRWVGNVNPSSESVTFNPVGGQITWDAGSIKPKSDVASSGQKEVAFQIAFLPSISQVGSAPILLSGQMITGLDRFASVELSSTRKALTTKLTTDSSFPFNGGDVISVSAE
ncbi:MAG: hypothetical protein QGH85_02290 [Candidatus Pacebacteria bacterium]|jgi:hypothetical protein|nr:hypothetical protein [Candidatus Paceibacterota bacterium]MDP7159000.1 hypothetical protein [Candidatus Paceibacterota bacterium]MDP7366564.1 hypothetical protein [Candidatus Paceibacterota bacterium]MDP7466426.1 hypothetical protein [Candidatus Paceibacterota bacterium]MDP7648384.1 hypothetical protein [Candidatus Paceibacterota bacterium]|tara:strand:- start:3513 stop:5438 length:1926 start_codon:yes stop_codon:yes gene_type:complete